VKKYTKGQVLLLLFQLLQTEDSSSWEAKQMDIHMPFSQQKKRHFHATAKLLFCYLTALAFTIFLSRLH